MPVTMVTGIFVDKAKWISSISPVSLWALTARPSALPIDLHGQSRASGHSPVPSCELPEPLDRHLLGGKIFQCAHPSALLFEIGVGLYRLYQHADRAHAFAPDDIEFIGKHASRPFGDVAALPIDIDAVDRLQ